MNISDKYCPSCKLRKSIDEFYANKSPIWAKVRAYCKQCELEKGRKYKQSHPEKMRQLKQAWDLRNKDRKREHERKYRWKVGFKGRGLSIPLIRGLYIAHPYCEYCHVALNHDEVSIDHRIPLSRGGAFNDAENLAISCRDCNRLKHTRTEQEFRQFLTAYSKRVRDNTELTTKVGMRDGQGIDPINAPQASA